MNEFRAGRGCVRPSSRADTVRGERDILTCQPSRHLRARLPLSATGRMERWFRRPAADAASGLCAGRVRPLHQDGKDESAPV